MDLRLTGKHALVTGASKGIGAATARTLAREGCDVTLVARSEDALRAQAESIAADLSRTEEVERVAAAAGTAIDSSGPNADGSWPTDLFLKAGDSVEVRSPAGSLIGNVV